MAYPVLTDDHAADYARRSIPHLAIWLLATVLLAALWLHSQRLIDEYHAQTVAGTENDLVNLGRFAQEHAERTFRNADTALRLIAFEFLQHQGQIDLKAMTRAGLFDTGILLQTSIVDAKGILLASSLPFSGRINLSDREHFKVHAAANNDELFVSRPVLGRASGKWSIQLSRRIPGKNGEFAGIVVASLDPGYFTRFYRELKLGAQPLATLFGLDGGIRARYTADGDLFTGDVPASPFFQTLAAGGQSATLTRPGLIDGIERTYHFRKLPSFPLVVVIGMKTQDIFAAHELKKGNLLRQAGLISFLLLALAAVSSWYVLTRQRHARAEQQALRQLQSITSRAPGLLYQYVKPPRGRPRLTFASAGTGDIFRLSPAEVTSDVSQVFRLTHPDDAGALKASIRHAARTLSRWSHNYRIRFADGSVRWLSGAAMPQRQGNGTVVWNGYISDITELRTLEALLDNQHADRQATLEAIPDLMFELDLAGRYHACHAHRMDLLAAPTEALLGKRVAEVPPPDATAVVMAALQEAQARGRSVGKQYALTLAAGEMWFELSVARKTMPGDETPHFIILARDVTESRRVLKVLRESEAREWSRSEELGKLLDATPAAVFIAHDAKAAEITGNRLAYQWLGLPAGENPSPPAGGGPATVDPLRHGGALAPVEIPLQLAASGVQVSDFECDFIHPDATRCHVLANAIPLLDELGRPRGAIAAFVDITAHQQTKLALLAARAEADQANNAKSRFLAAASHDLRQPLSALGLYVTLLKNSVAPVDQRMVANMSDCIASLTELLSDLLDLSKLQAEVVKPRPANFALAGLLSGLESVHAPEARLKGLRLRCVASPSTVHTDPVLFRRILGNFIANAIRYTESGAILVACRRARGKTWVEVRDSGIGIPADKTGEIFEEFRQLGDATRHKGSGLGLAIVAKTAALLGLEIRLRSQPGRGSVFAIELPVVPPALLLPTSAPPAMAFRPLRIAVVEDHPLARAALVDGLQSLGHRVVAAAGKAALLAELGQQPPDIVLSDYRLARGETGVDVIAAVRARHGAALPALLVSGDTDPQLLRRINDSGIVMLHKPLDLETLQAYLEDLTYQVS